MIALDTNSIVRMLIEDDKKQAKAVQDIVKLAEKNSKQILVLSEVLIETVWVLESVYKCPRNEIVNFLATLISNSVFIFKDSLIIRSAIKQYKQGEDFADLIIVGQAKKQNAKIFFSFDKKLQKLFPDYVVEKIKNAEPLGTA